MSKYRIAIISYFDKNPRTLAHYNHEAYARKHGYTYIFDKAPTTHEGFYTKIDKILKFIDHFDYVFWIDDDAFFMQQQKSLEQFIDQHPNTDMILCKSPINQQGQWTYFSSGNFFIKNTPRAKEYFQKVLRVNLKKVERKWNAEKFGLFTWGDQDAMIHVINSSPRKYAEGSFYTRLPFEAFNSRPYHFTKKLSDQFIVHFAGVPDKVVAIQEFADRFNLDTTLIKSAKTDLTRNILK